MCLLNTLHKRIKMFLYLICNFGFHFLPITVNDIFSNLSNLSPLTLTHTTSPWDGTFSRYTDKVKLNFSSRNFHICCKQILKIKFPFNRTKGLSKINTFYTLSTHESCYQPAYIVTEQYKSFQNQKYTPTTL